MSPRFNAPPGWPEPPAGWLPPAGWVPDSEWPPAPAGWQFVVDDATCELTSHGQPGDVWVTVGKPITGIGAIRVRMDHAHLFVERGVITTDAQQVPLAAIVDVDAAQSPAQKLRGVGTVRVRVNRFGAIETMTLDDLEDFRQGVQIINQHARQARVAETQLQHTQHVAYAQASAPLPAVPAPAPRTAPPLAAGGAQDDVLATLERLGRLREAGALSDEEFNDKKRELLARL